MTSSTYMRILSPHAQQLILRSALEWADMCRLAEQGGRA